jgi:protein-tyrosine phosphatase
MVRPSYWPKGGMPHRTEDFSWIVRGKFAASWWPDSSLFKRYRQEGVSVIINCSEFDNKKDIPEGFYYYHLNVPDYGLPTEEQISRFLKICNEHGQQNETIVVHCVAGCGRTGQFVVAWAAHNGYIPKNMDPVKWIRRLRPCSLETQEQMEFARKLARKYQSNK